MASTTSYRNSSACIFYQWWMKWYIHSFCVTDIYIYMLTKGNATYLFCSPTRSIVSRWMKWATQWRSTKAIFKAKAIQTIESVWAQESHRHAEYFIGWPNKINSTEKIKHTKESTSEIVALVSRKILESSHEPDRSMPDRPYQKMVVITLSTYLVPGWITNTNAATFQ